MVKDLDARIGKSFRSQRSFRGSDFPQFANGYKAAKANEVSELEKAVRQFERTRKTKDMFAMFELIEGSNV